MPAAMPNGTDVWMAVPASPPLRMTIRACLDDRCEECRLPVYHCESEAGQMLRLCAESSPTLEMICCSASRDWKSDEALPWLCCKGPTQSLIA